MKHCKWQLAAALAFVSAPAAQAQVAYTVTNLIDTNSQFQNFGHFLSADDGSPAMNASGTVAFWAQLDSGPQGFFTLNGGTVTTIADNSGTFTDFHPRRPSINGAGAVAFFAQTTTGPGVFSGSGGSVTTIANTSTPFPGQPGTFGGFTQRPSIGPGGTVAFAGSSGSASGFFTGAGGALTTLAFTGFNAASGATAINSGGNVAFHHNNSSGVDFQRISAGTGGQLTTLASPVGPPLANSFFYPSFNSSNRVAFWSLIDGGGEGIFTSDGGAPVTIADTSGPFAAFFLEPCIGGDGTVFFLARLDGDPNFGIYSGPNPVTNKIITRGDQLFGSTVEALFLSSFGANESGSLSFYYFLTDGRTGLALATPVPEPTSLVLLGVAGIALGYRRYRSIRGSI